MKATKDIRARATKLHKLLKYHAHRYYTLDTPEISDSAYDALYKELRTIEEQYPEIKQEDSVTRRVVGDALPFLKKVRHTVKQWSFNDAFTEEDIYAFNERVQKILGAVPTYDMELKIDGLKIVLAYKNGKLVTAVTRGDGIIGEDVTHNIRTIASVPKRLLRPISLVAEGEVFLTRSGFEELNKKRKKLGELLFANPRNAAAGSVRQLDPNIAKARPLEVFMYDVSSTSEALPLTQSSELNYLKKLGLPVNKEHIHADSLEEIFAYWKKWNGNARDKVDYQIDGIVLKVESRKDQEILGYTSKAPRFGIAYKFPPEQVETIVEDITLQVGRTGKLTPVAHLRAVAIAGTTVARASLHNEDFIKEKDIRIGDTVILQKAGDIIPEIVSVIRELRPHNSRIWNFPKTSSLCGGNGEIKRVVGESAHRCKDMNSFEQQVRKLAHFAGKSALDIGGMGSKTMQTLMEQNLVSDFDDIFEITKDELLVLDGFEEKKSQKLIDAIIKAKEVSFDRFLIGLGISHIGGETALIIATHFATLAKLRSASVTALSNIDGVGPIIGRSVAIWLADKNNSRLLVRLEKHITIKKVTTFQKEHLAGQVVVITGTLPTLSRGEVGSLVRKAGGKITTTVSVKTTFVIAGENPGSKYTKAQLLGIPVMSETDFLKKIHLDVRRPSGSFLMLW